MPKQKIIQIADAVHGSIQVSILEKRIISTQVFNRLHNIMQNSTAYLTYPSNETKRFEHSLGSLCLVGKMFYHSIVNSDPSSRQEFMKQITAEIDNIANAENFRRRVRISVGNAQSMENFDRRPPGEPLYMANIPGVIEPSETYNFILVWQAIRCAALLHDVGHPPFSHVTESALNDLLSEIERIPDNERNGRQKSFVETLAAYVIEDGQLHEEMGLRMADRLLESLCRLNASDTMKYFTILVHELTICILKESSELFQDLHYLVSGALDCDRLDYVVRDLKNSGFGNSQIEYDRLLHSMRLVHDGQRFRWCPDVRALSTVEDFFHKRWSLYKYMIYHHRVIKTDFLLQQAVLSLGRDYLSENLEDDKNAQYVLPMNISGLWKALPESLSDESYFDALIQWDDAWLLSVLRKEFFGRYREEEDNPVKYQLEELLSNRKYYSSLIKRADDFTAIDASIAQSLSVDWDKLHDVTKSLGPSAHILHNDMTYYCTEEQGEAVPKIGFFVNRFRKVFDLICGKESFKNVVQGAVADAAIVCRIPHCFVVFKNLKTGLQTSPDLYKAGAIVPLEEVSRIKEDLTSNQMVFPAFFIYWRKEFRVDEENFKREIGERIGYGLSRYITEGLKRQQEYDAT